LLEQGPRIYNLFPLLAGPIAGWEAHLPRIAAMGFDWVYVNPFHYPGFSGSLYAIKDFDRLHPVVRGGAEAHDDALIHRFVKAADAAGLSVMVDLVINHTSRDAVLVDRHPDWFRREPDGGLRSPRAVDPLDPRSVTVWGDLAEIDYGQPALRPAQTAFWGKLIDRYLNLGIRGFRCDAAYQVPAALWADLIEGARTTSPNVLFAAETLGCTLEQALDTAAAGFDIVFDSGKWWDFRGDWLLDQYHRLRRAVPTIGFPESHDTPRLINELDATDAAGIEAAYRQRYLFAVAFSGGVMMPMGYEYGFAKALHVVDSRPGDWAWEADAPRFDLSGFIAEANRQKAVTPALNGTGPQRRLTAPHSLVTGLLRLDAERTEETEDAVLTLINTDGAAGQGVDPGPLLFMAGEHFGPFIEVTPGADSGTELLPGAPLTLGPAGIRLFRAAPAAPIVAQRPWTEAMTEQRLSDLAARRVTIEAVAPEVDGGRHPVKRVVGDSLTVSADIFGDGHDRIAAALKLRPVGQTDWQEVPMVPGDNDRWEGTLPLPRMGRFEYTIDAWRDLFGAWRQEVTKKHDAGVDVRLEIREGLDLLGRAADRAADRADGNSATVIRDAIARVEAAGGDIGTALSVLLAEPVEQAMAAAAERTNLTTHTQCLPLVVDRPKAVFAAWYEMFPRSASGDERRHGTFDDVIARLPYVRDMGFDVLYFTPIHPIGRRNRKGRNNSLTPGPDDVGSPYAIGAAEGGHDAIHPDLGTEDDFRRLVARAADHGLEIALDFAVQCAPDHPWLTEHPAWFDWRPDGSIKFAENPPKKYEDIVNVHFYREALPSIWYALRDVVLHWVELGVKIFRVDNPHTKPFPFWEWLIEEVQRDHPDVIFLAEAFTRPKVMKKLAKLGFTQSYTYFTWRPDKAGLIDYLTELTQTEAREYFRPNFFPNTPDINPPYLHDGSMAMHKVRLLLAATLSGVYGMYNGFEICEATPVPGKEEYLDSEKYQLRAFDWDRSGNIRGFIAAVNRIRRENPALHGHHNLRFYNAWNDNIIVYGKATAAMDNMVLIAANLDKYNAQGAHFEVPLWEFGLPDEASIEVEDLLTGHRFTWHGKVQHVWLDPAQQPCAIWRLIPPGG